MAPSIGIMNGSSRTGTQLAELALAGGSDVHMIVRSASRVSRSLTEKPSPKLHIHEVKDMFSPAALQPILAKVDFLLLVFIMPTDRCLEPTSLNLDGATAAAAAIRAESSGAAPRTKIILLSSEVVHPEMRNTIPARIMWGAIPHQFDDLARTERFLAAQQAWGLEWAAMQPGGIVGATPEEPLETRRDNVVLKADPRDLDQMSISFGRLGGGMLKLMQDWDTWKNGTLTPVPTGAKVKSSVSDSLADVGGLAKTHALVFAKKLSWWTALLTAGWVVGVRLGDMGTGAWLQSLMKRVS